MNIFRTVGTRLRTFEFSRIPERNRVLLLSFLVGLFSGFAAILLKNIIHISSRFLTEDVNQLQENYRYFLYPGIGILLTYLYVRFIVKDDISHGVTKVLESISRKKGYLRAHNMFTSIISSTITIGFGGSVGAEAPVVLTGSAIGSNIARTFHLNYRTMTVLIGCGAAGAISGIFKAPLAGMLFAIEVLMLDLTMTSLLPLMISASTAASLAYFLMGSGYELNFQIDKAFRVTNIHWYILLGIFCGLFSILFIRGNIFVESHFKKIKSPLLRIALGGLSLGGMIFLFPALWGEGYVTINQIVNDLGHHIVNNSLFFDFRDDKLMLIVLVFAIMLVKIVATATTNGAGGSGGIFAPTLFLGSLAGFLISLVLNYNGEMVPAKNFALAGMAGMMAAVMHSPMTAIFLIAEITGGFGLLVPLMITSAVAYLTSIPIEPHSLYHKRLAIKGDLITHNKDKAVLTLLRLHNVIEKDLQTVKPEDTLGDLVKVIAKSKRNVFPVVDEQNQYKGVVLLDDVREIMFNKSKYPTKRISELMTFTSEVIFHDDKMDEVMRKFTDSGAWNLPVVQNGKYVGFISKSRIFNAYRELLVNFTEE
ncbi:MAG: chloride channel protein [Marinilabiliales bacterium]|nr:chloride channel protein [Marinilabiliales bacterium]